MYNSRSALQYASQTITAIQLEHLNTYAANALQVAWNAQTPVYYRANLARMTHLRAQSSTKDTIRLSARQRA